MKNLTWADGKRNTFMGERFKKIFALCTKGAKRAKRKALVRWMDGFLREFDNYRNRYIEMR